MRSKSNKSTLPKKRSTTHTHKRSHSRSHHSHISGVVSGTNRSSRHKPSRTSRHSHISPATSETGRQLHVASSNGQKLGKNYDAAPPTSLTRQFKMALQNVQRDPHKKPNQILNHTLEKQQQQQQQQRQISRQSRVDDNSPVLSDVSVDSRNVGSAAAAAQQVYNKNQNEDVFIWDDAKMHEADAITIRGISNRDKISRKRNYCIPNLNPCYCLFCVVNDSLEIKITLKTWCKIMGVWHVIFGLALTIAMSILWPTKRSVFRQFPVWKILRVLLYMEFVIIIIGGLVLLFLTGCYICKKKELLQWVALLHTAIMGGGVLLGLVISIIAPELTKTKPKPGFVYNYWGWRVRGMCLVGVIYSVFLILAALSSFKVWCDLRKGHQGQGQGRRHYADVAVFPAVDETVSTV